MFGVPYALSPIGQGALEYYKETASLAKETDIALSTRFRAIVDSYLNYLETHDIEPLRLATEYRLELLSLGVYWLEYSQAAAHLRSTPARVLKFLARIRARGTTFKYCADMLRGPLATFFLYIENISATPPLEPSLDNLNSLLRWLEATGEFTHVVSRLRMWQVHWATLGESSTRDALAACIDAALDFKGRSEAVLDTYTKGVRSYTVSSGPSHRWREDYMLISRPSLDYHLNMVGAEMLNLAYRQGFLLTAQKVVLVPHCMRQPQTQCLAEPDEAGLRCKCCSEKCQVGMVAKLGKEYGYGVLIITHETEALKSAATGSKDSLGVIGVACALNLLEGGWKARALNYPAQCVLLNYPGCKAHWHKEGVPTALDLKRLTEIMTGGTQL